MKGVNGFICQRNKNKYQAFGSTGTTKIGKIIA